MLTQKQIEFCEAEIKAYEGHPNLGFNCCSAHRAADIAEDLLAEVKQLRERDATLTALEAYGVDNWDGYDEAVQSLENR
jgi:hypothetical protein